MRGISTGCNSSWYCWPGPLTRFLVVSSYFLLQIFFFNFFWPYSDSKRSRKFLTSVALASALVTSFGAIPSPEAVSTYPPTLVTDGGLCEKGKQQTIRTSIFWACEWCDGLVRVNIHCKIEGERRINLKLSLLGFFSYFVVFFVFVKSLVWGIEFKNSCNSRVQSFFGCRHSIESVQGWKFPFYLKKSP